MEPPRLGKFVGVSGRRCREPACAFHSDKGWTVPRRAADGCCAAPEIERYISSSVIALLRPKSRSMAEHVAEHVVEPLNTFNAPPPRRASGKRCTGMPPVMPCDAGVFFLSRILRRGSLESCALYNIVLMVLPTGTRLTATTRRQHPGDCHSVTTWVFTPSAALGHEFQLADSGRLPRWPARSVQGEPERPAIVFPLWAASRSGKDMQSSDAEARRIANNEANSGVVRVMDF